MGLFRWVLLLAALSTLVCGSIALGASEVEVALGADGSVIDEKRLLEAVATDLDAGHQETRVPSSTAPHNVGAEKNRESAAGVTEEGDVVAVMTTLQRELAEVEHMVKLQEKKLQVLQEMRSGWLQERKEHKMQEDTRRKRRVDVAEIVERRLDAAVAETVAASTMRDFDTYFVERAPIRLDGEVADMKMMKTRAGSVEELIAIAYRDGVVVFFTSEGEELLRVDTDKKEVTSVALELQDEQPCLVVTYETPELAIYEFNMVQKSDAGSDGQVLKTEQHSMLTISVGHEYLLSVSGQRHLQLSAKASAVAIARSSRQLVVAVAQVDGVIEFFSLNGTSLRQVQTSASIAAMEARRNVLAFSNGTDVVISSMTRAQGSVFHTCPGSSALVLSIAFDAMQPEIMYAGTQRGEILVYAVNAEAQACRLLSRSTVTRGPRPASPVVLATTKMYVIAAGPHNIAVFNVSKTQRNGVSLSRLCSSGFNEVFGPTEGYQRYLPAISFSEGAMGSHLAIIRADEDGQSQLALFHSLLPDERGESDFQWTIFAYAGVVIVAIVGSQLFIRWQRQSSVNPWDSVGKAHDSPYGKFGGLNGHDNVSEFDGEDFGRYNSLSDELRRKIAQAKKGSARHGVGDDDADY
ncbi:hypothetical protein PHYPSEUDO_007114 [Phytophthora pseudosyringae]|uniref:Uncharacterized protein n=1 Tax=Phytophthora pseudosyringae TaxID=221518 RepID=A0A8T1W9H6_9STRA|nr:hypothetical protein PHYPSEUDO_007114 [Phytophthora pseudosyringae]